MFYRIFLGVGLTALTLLFSVSSPVMAGEIESKILQYRLGRFYFAAGREARVFRNSRFTVYHTSDSIYEGVIGQSYLGVSISDSGIQFPESLQLDSCYALIETADVDSVTMILNVHTEISLGPAYWVVNERNTSRGYYLRLKDTEWYTSTRNSFPLCFLSYVDDPRQHKGSYQNRITSPAPFIAVIIPNLGSELNRNGFLSTSLYYRFNDSTMSRYFTGSPVASQHTLYISSNGTQRFYPHDPKRGRRLIKHIISDRGTVRINPVISELRNLRYYFVDVLSRDKFGISWGNVDPPADIYLMLVPAIQSKPVGGLAHIVALLKRHSPIDKSKKEQLKIIDQRIEAAHAAKEIDAKIYYCELIDRSLKEDFGVFPLFRPYITFYYNDQLEGCYFDSDGRLLVDSLILLKLPEPDRNRSR